MSLGGDLNGHSDCLLEIGLSLFIYRLHILDVDVGDFQVVLLEKEGVLDLALRVHPEDTLADETSTGLVEGVEVNTSHSRPYLVGHQVAQITYEVLDVEDLLALFGIALLYVEPPVVGEHQTEGSMVTGLYGDHVSAEGRA